MRISRSPVAINFGWETPASYRKWSNDPDPAYVERLKRLDAEFNATLRPGGRMKKSIVGSGKSKGRIGGVT